MNKSQLIRAVRDRTALPLNQAEGAVSALFDMIAAEVDAGRDVRISGFGTFTTIERAATTRRNPANGTTIQVPAKRAVRFRASAQLLPNA